MTAYGANMVNGPLVLLHVVVALGNTQELKLPLLLVAVLHVLAQQQRKNPAMLMHVQVVKY